MTDTYHDIEGAESQAEWEYEIGSKEWNNIIN
jgi:hypothetical protein